MLLAKGEVAIRVHDYINKYVVQPERSFTKKNWFQFLILLL